MTSKAKIKVIKKKEIQATQVAPAAAKAVPAAKAKKQAAREVVSTVSNWVTDFQQKRREETKQAFEKLFLQHPQANGV